MNPKIEGFNRCVCSKCGAVVYIENSRTPYGPPDAQLNFGHPGDSGGITCPFHEFSTYYIYPDRYRNDETEELHDA